MRNIIIIISLVLAVASSVNAQSKFSSATASKFAKVSTGGSKAVLDSNSVNINTATADQLDALPRIGAVKAQRIVEYRDSLPNKQFSSNYELMNVKGIGPKTLEQMWYALATLPGDTQ